MKKFSLLTNTLTHFLLLGALVFVTYNFLNPSSEADPEQVIVVNEPSLLEFVQYRSKQFDEQQALKRLRSTNGDAMAELIDEFVAEEALYRSAKRFELEADDYVIRRRLVQKMDFMAEGVATSDVKVDAAFDRARGYPEPATSARLHVRRI